MKNNNLLLEYELRDRLFLVKIFCFRITEKGRKKVGYWRRLLNYCKVRFGNSPVLTDCSGPLEADFARVVNVDSVCGFQYNGIADSYVPSVCSVL